MLVTEQEFRHECFYESICADCMYVRGSKRERVRNQKRNKIVSKIILKMGILQIRLFKNFLNNQKLRKNQYQILSAGVNIFLFFSNVKKDTTNTTIYFSHDK